MNLELLIKLVKLANNNPNDNEANLAARKVCKMIAEANFQFPGNGHRVDARARPFDVGDIFEQFRRDVEEQTRRESERSERRREREANAYSSVWDIPYQESASDWTPPRYSPPPRQNPPPPRPEKRPLQCTKCGNTIMTGFVGVPQAFVCNKCHWQNYQDGAK